ncbi:hypothetical protein KSD_47130 [Ktedonobacter sp. SOSP1-85]|uniref:hypothetical protein n=1 Tax=Ktedonobacter sp. SOSP1-85 TaxID=2778367 RepID=UPI0019161BEA|nr:hypothetical protein [Ktedonobacter sp. SOSP1-85]GHO76942.1 hypothetical protein KSD_47130 [Ktedonobacter sp. SOSP1-85]
MRKRQLLSLLLIVSGLLVMGCGTPTEAAQVPQPNKLHIVIHSVDTNTSTEKNVSSLDSVQKVYDHIRALPVIPAGQICTLMAGPTYDLTFSRNGATVLTAKADAGGCGTVKLSGKDIRLADKELWQTLNEA